MKKIFALMLIALIALVACGVPSTTTAPTTAPAANTPVASAPTTAPVATTSPVAQGPKEIVLGAALPLTGGSSREGGLMKKGYDLAINEINAAGGIMVKEFNRKIPVKLIVYDDKTDNTTSVALYTKLATEDKVDAFLGGYSTPLVEAHTLVPNQYQIPYINGGGATGTIYEKGNKWIFGMLASIEKLSVTMMDWLEVQQDAGKLSKPSKIALLYENTSHGAEFSKGIKDRATAKPERFTVVVDEKFEINGKDFSPLITKVKGAGADLFIVDARQPDYTLMQRQYTEAGLYHKVVSYGPRGPEKAARDALGDASNFLVAANWWSVDMSDPASKAFTDKFKAANNNETPEWYSALGYETAVVLFKAIEAAGTLDKAKMRDALAATNLTGQLVVGGTVKFKANGQIDNPYIMTQNAPNQKVNIIYPDNLKTGDAVVPLPK